MSEERADRLGPGEDVEPKRLMNLLDWAALYPMLPLQTVALSFAEANNATRCRNVMGESHHRRRATDHRPP